MNQISNSKQYDLEERTFNFAKQVGQYINKLPRTVTNLENGKQLARSSGSVGANYIEANESLSKKDFVSRFWLMLSEPLKENLLEKERLIDECTQIMKIFGAILEKSR